MPATRTPTSSSSARSSPRSPGGASSRPSRRRSSSRWAWTTPRLPAAHAAGSSLTSPRPCGRATRCWTARRRWPRWPPRVDWSALSRTRWCSCGPCWSAHCSSRRTRSPACRRAGTVSGCPVTGRRSWRRAGPSSTGWASKRYRLPRLLNAGRRSPTFIGHTGASGSWLFWCPEHDLYLAGTVDQTTAAGVPYRQLPKLVHRLGG